MARCARNCTIAAVKWNKVTMRAVFRLLRQASAVHAHASCGVLEVFHVEHYPDCASVPRGTLLPHGDKGSRCSTWNIPPRATSKCSTWNISSRKRENLSRCSRWNVPKPKCSTWNIAVERLAGTICNLLMHNQNGLTIFVH